VSSDQADSLVKLAACSLLQSFYNGVDNIFAAVAREIDKGPPPGPDWRHKLPAKMAIVTQNRPAVISESLREALEPYKDFREAFRYAHYFRLNWEDIVSLVQNLRGVMGRLEDNLNAFLEAVGSKPLATPDHSELPAAFWAKPRKTPPPGKSRPMAVACGLSIMLGAWLGIAAMVLYHQFLRQDKQVIANPEAIVAAIEALRESPGYKTLTKDRASRDYLGELFVAGAYGWVFIAPYDRWQGSMSEGFTGEVAAFRRTEEHVEQVFMSFDGGKLAKVSWSGVVYRAMDNQLVRYERHGPGPDSHLPVVAIDFNSAGQRIHRDYQPQLKDPDIWSGNKPLPDGKARSGTFFVDGKLMVRVETAYDGRVTAVEVHDGDKVIRYIYDNAGRIIGPDPQTQPADK